MGYDYYWKDYDGTTIPDDAYPLLNAETRTYIGQVYIHNHGIFIGTIHEGQNFMEVSAYGDKKPDILIKILCTQNPDNFSWLKTTRKDYHADIIDKYPVTAGYDYEFNHGFMDIGRVSYNNSLIAGSITSFAQEPYLYWAYGGKDFKVTAFEVFVNTPAEKK